MREQGGVRGLLGGQKEERLTGNKESRIPKCLSWIGPHTQLVKLRLRGVKKCTREQRQSWNSNPRLQTHSSEIFHSFLRRKVHSQQVEKCSFSHCFITQRSRAEGFGEQPRSPFLPLNTSSDPQGYILPLSGKKVSAKLSLTSLSSSVKWVQ